jgi:uncharacterized repeat protein (TIGR01451 family)
LCNAAVVNTAEGVSEKASHCVKVGEAKLTLAKTGPKTSYLNIPATYFITVRNPGTSAATNVVITDPVPDKMTFIRASNAGRLKDNVVRWDIGTLEPGQNRTVQVTLQARAAGAILNQATAAAARGLKATAKVVTNFKGVSALFVELVDTEDPVEVGEETSYVITVKNQGMVPVTNILVIGLVPHEVTVIKATGPVDNQLGALTRTGRPLIYEPLKALAPGATVTYRITVKAQRPGDARFKVDVIADQLKAGGPVHEEESTTIFSQVAPIKP